MIEKQFYGRAKPGSGRVSVSDGSGLGLGGIGAAGGGLSSGSVQDRRRVLM